MTDDLMGYHKLVEEAMRDVVRGALEKAARDGLPGDHHFYVTFRTTAPGVSISDRLKAQYPEEMTIVIQHQFWGLEISRKRFQVTLSFGGASEALTIPFAAVVGFVDPAVSFGLQFGGGPGALKEKTEVAAESPPEVGTPPQGTGDETTPGDTGPGASPPEGGDVVRLDTFRKK